MLTALSLTLTSALPALAADTETMARTMMRRSSDVLSSNRPAMFKRLGRRNARAKKFSQSKNRRALKHHKRMMQRDVTDSPAATE